MLRVEETTKTKNVVNRKQENSSLKNTALPNLESVSLRLPKVKKDTPKKRPQRPGILVHPPKDHRASNVSKDLPPISLLNGINMDARKRRAAALALSKVKGRPVLMIENDTQGFFTDLRNAFRGIVSPNQGAKAEKDAYNATMNYYKFRMADDHPIEAMCYSQATIITSNVLISLRKELEESGESEKWNQLASRIKLHTVGQAQTTFPVGIEVRRDQHALDPVTAISGIVGATTQVQEALRGKYDYAEISSVTIKSSEKGWGNRIQEAHDFKLYMKNNAEFLVGHLKKLPVRTQAKELLHSMKEGTYSDAEIRKVLVQISAPLKDTKKTNSLREWYQRKHAVELSTQLLANIPENGIIGELNLGERAMDSLQKAALTEIGPQPGSKATIADRRQRPGRRR